MIEKYDFYGDGQESLGNALNTIPKALARFYKCKSSVSYIYLWGTFIT